MCSHLTSESPTQEWNGSKNGSTSDFLPASHEPNQCSFHGNRISGLFGSRLPSADQMTNQQCRFHHTSAEMLFIPSLFLCLCFFSLSTKICQLQINIKPRKLKKKTNKQKKKPRMQSGGLWDKNNIRMSGFYSGFDRWNTVRISVSTC